jgi:hypothetical protein
MTQYPLSALDHIQSSLSRFNQLEEATRVSSAIERALSSAGEQAKLRMDKMLGGMDIFKTYMQQMESSASAAAAHALSQQETVRKALELSGLHENISRAAINAIDKEAANHLLSVSGISEYLENSKSLQATLSSIANPWWEKSASQILESMSEREQLMKQFAFNGANLTAPKVSLIAHGIAEAASKEVTLDDALKMIVEAIGEAKEPETRKWLWFILLPLIFMLLQAFINPLADVYVKKSLAESEQESTKQINSRAAEAVGDNAWLSEHRFVARKSLKVTSNASIKSPAVGQLEYGQAVRLLEKQGDFTLVVWRSSDGEGSLRGWVLSRYLKRFG